ncbi:retrovirus-related Pol polyprotein from transposon 17.6 [Trichonephila clavipes]|nr:retrovirus-related Pol polyprotein from transposon 17.6 [Trichonephila clavipes]
MVLPAGQGQVPHPSIVPERFTINQLWNDRCTWPWGHCLLSELREWRLQTDRHNRLKTVRSAGCKCLPFLLVKSAREVPAFRFFPEKDKEEVSSVSTCNVKCIMAFLLRERKDVLLEVAKELRVEIDITLPKIEFKKRICQSKYYDEESVKCLLEGILEEREKQEIKEYEERRLARERELERLRIQLRNKLNENKLKAGNRINDLANVCILSGNRTTEVSESVNKCRPVNNPVVSKSVENATSCDFEKKNCDPPVRCTNVSHPSEVGRKEYNVNRSSDCDVEMKVGVCEGRVKTVAMGAQRVIIPDNIVEASFELKRDKGVANPEGLICENSCEEKYTLGTLRGCEKQLTVNREGFRIHTIAKIAGLLKGKEDTCKADVLTCLEDGLAMRLPLSEPREIYKDSLETDNQFEKRKPIICYYCNETGHIKPVCPRLRKNNFETVANLTLNTGNYDPFKKFKMNMEINGIDRVCLRDSGSSIDVCSRSWINENDLLGEYVWLKSPLDEICHCLPLAKIEIKTKKGEFYTKAAIKQDSSDNDLYLLGNRTAELLESDEQGVHLVNTVVTRSKQKRFFPEKEKEANEVEFELTDFSLPSEGGEDDSFIIPAFEGEGGKSLAKVNGVEFKEEQRKYPDLKPLWDKAQTGIDKEFMVIRGKLVRVAKTKRGEEVFSKINIDAVGPLPVSTKQNRYLITSICVASKYPEAIPVESITSPNVIDALLSIFSRIGFPREIQSDLGTSFTSELTTTFFNKFGIKVTRSSVSHPQSNAVERVHRTIKRVIKALCVESGEDWEGVLPLALFSLRTVAHESTGFSPTELVMGKNLRTPQTLVYEEWMEEGNTSQSVVEYILQLNNRLKRCEDIAIKNANLKGKRGTIAMSWNGNLWKGIWKKGPRSTIYHVNLLKPYHRRPELVSLVVEEFSDDIEGDAEIPYPDKQCTKFDYLEKLRESQLQLKLSPSQIDELKQVITKNKDVFSPDPGTIVLRQKDTNLVTGKPFRIKTCCSSQMLINSLREDTEYLLDLGVNGMGESNRTLPVVWLGRVNRYPYPRIKCIKYGNLNQVTRAEIYFFFKKGKFVRKDQRGIVGDCIGFMEMVSSSFTTDELSEAHPMRYASWHVHYYKIEV